MKIHMHSIQYDSLSELNDTEELAGKGDHFMSETVQDNFNTAEQNTKSALPPSITPLQTKTLAKDQASSFKKSKIINKKIASLRFLIPSKYREEVIGDLIETVTILKNEGHDKRWIAFIFSWQVINVLWAMWWFKLGELVSNKRDKEMSG